MTPEELQKLKELKAQKTRSIQNYGGLQQIERTNSSEKAKQLIAYKINITLEDREYLNDYIRTMTQRTGKIYRMSDAIKDAVGSLRENCQFTVLRKQK